MAPAPKSVPLFHLAMPVRDLASTRAFYGGLLGCVEGRSAKKWVDYDFFGHQLSFHHKPEMKDDPLTNPVDGKDVPVRHFGAILPWQTWHDLADRLKANNQEFVIDPYVRFKGKTGEQATMFFLDPSGNALEFKSFKDESQVFAT